MTRPLPEGWIEADLSSIATIVMGQSPPGSTYNRNGDGLPFFQGKADFGPKSPGARVWCNSPSRIAQHGDVLISVRAPVGPTNLADRECAIGRGLAAIRPATGVATEWLLYALTLARQHLEEQGTGSTFTAINRAVLESVSVRVPPSNEQGRIVERVEALLEQVNRAKSRLDRVSQTLKRFRQAVLAAAWSGELTRDWRETESGTKIGADALVQQLLHRNPKRVLSVRDDLDLPDLPISWCWVSLRFLMSPEEPFCYGVVQPGPHDPNGVPLIRAGDLHDLKNSLSGVRKIGPTIDRAYGRSRVSGGEILITVVGANIGTSVLAPDEARGSNIARAVAKVPVREVSAEYVLHWLRSRLAYSWMVGDAREVARPTLNLEQLETLPVPLTSLEEQEEIVRRVRILLHLAEVAEHRVDISNTHASRLGEAILTKAFSGELVPTEAELARAECRTYETALALLASIQAQDRTTKKAASASRRTASRGLRAVAARH